MKKRPSENIMDDTHPEWQKGMRKGDRAHNFVFASISDESVNHFYMAVLRQRYRKRDMERNGLKWRIR